MSTLSRKAAAVGRELRALQSFVAERRRARQLRRAWSDKARFAQVYFRDLDDARRRELDQVWEMRVRAPVPIGQPLVLISEVERSGGTLLSRLFDSHPQCHATPLHLYFTEPGTWAWPRLDRSERPDAWFTKLVDGSGQGSVSRRAGAGEAALPHLLLLTLQRDIFLRRLDSIGAPSPRDCMNAYWTSYFNAWLDNQNLYQPDKRVVVGFAPRLVMHGPSVDAFFEAYPYVLLFSIVRDPGTWVVSALSHDRRVYPDLPTAIGIWNRSTRSVVEARGRYPERVTIVRFEDLVRRTEDVMRRLAQSVGIDFHPALLAPSFNGMPVRANSHFADTGVAIDPAPLARDVAGLTPEQRAFVAEQTREAHAAVAPHLT